MAAQDQPLNVDRVGPDGMRCRRAVRTLLAAADDAGLLTSRAVGIAVSGGPDSLALTAATVPEAAARGLTTHALVVDHGLQAGSAAVAAEAAATARALGVDSAVVLEVDGAAAGGGPESAARTARYAALTAAQPDGIVLLGHTRDDQAETVLLGLGRGSGPRSIAGMRALDPPWGRPLLDVDSDTTEGACRELGLTPWQDPHNADRRFTRTRLRREVLPLLEDVLHGGVAAALARTAAQLAEDCAALDSWAGELYAAAADGDDLATEPLTPAPPAVRRRTIRRWLLDAGARDLTDQHLRTVDELVGRWRGQGGVWLPGDLVAQRVHGRLRIAAHHRGTR